METGRGPRRGESLTQQAHLFGGASLRLAHISIVFDHREPAMRGILRVSQLADTLSASSFLTRRSAWCSLRTAIGSARDERGDADGNTPSLRIGHRRVRSLPEL
jgi:hypothetical protein